MTTWCLPAVIVLVAAVSGHGDAQQPDPKFGAATTAVVIDVVVRDAKGRPVTDLTRADFELLEDRERQELGDVTRVGVPVAASPRAAASAGTAPTPAPTHNSSSKSVAAPAFVALVFDRLEPEARALAHKGALAYLDTLQDNDFVGVFLSDLSLVTIQTYSNDRAQLRRALDEVATRAPSVFGDRTGKATDDGTIPVVASADSAGRRIVNGQMIMEGLPGGGQKNSWDSLERDQQGYATTTALLTLTGALGTLQGRKTVMFFAEGLAIPDAVLPHFRDVVVTANRGNVSVYTIDAAGLRVHSKDAETGRAVRAAGKAGITLTPDGSNSSNLGVLEANEDVLRRDPRTSLTLLARETGGFLIDNTNDLAAGLRRIDTDRRFHYLLTYTPKNVNFGGEWRRVEVRVPSRKVEIRSRSGYLAVRTLSAIPVLAYEGPALAALERTPPPADLPLRLGAFVFPDVKGGSRAALMVAASGPTLTFAAAPEGFRTDFVLMARVKDDKGEVVRKGSQPYRLAGPAADRERAQKGEVLFYRQPELQPGHYTLEGVVHDALALRAGVMRMPLAVPGETGLRASDLVIVSRTERLMSGELDPDNPLQIRDRLIYPNLGEPLQRRRTDTVGFYVTIVPSGAEPVEARLHILQAGHVVAELPVPIDKADATGRIQQVGQMPAGGLGAGDFQFRLVIQQGGARVVREARFRLEIGA